MKQNQQVAERVAALWWECNDHLLKSPFVMMYNPDLLALDKENRLPSGNSAVKSKMVEVDALLKRNPGAKSLVEGAIDAIYAKRETENLQARRGGNECHA